jgi:hypothetical protein
VNTLYCLEKWRGENFTPRGHFHPRGTKSPLGVKFAPKGEVKNGPQDFTVFQLNFF